MKHSEVIEMLDAYQKAVEEAARFRWMVDGPLPKHGEFPKYDEYQAVIEKSRHVLAEVLINATTEPKTKLENMLVQTHDPAELIHMAFMEGQKGYDKQTTNPYPEKSVGSQVWVYGYLARKQDIDHLRELWMPWTNTDTSYILEFYNDTSGGDPAFIRVVGWDELPEKVRFPAPVVEVDGVPYTLDARQDPHQYRARKKYYKSTRVAIA